MLQFRASEAVQADDDLPDFGLGKLARSVTGAADAANANANELVATALSTAGQTVNGTVGKAQDAVDKYAARVNETVGRVKYRVLALLADAFSVKIPGHNAWNEDKDLVLALVAQADEVAQTSLSSVTGTSSLLDALPSRVFNMTGRVNGTFQAASSQCQSFSDAIKDVMHVLKDNFTRAKSAALQTREIELRMLPEPGAADLAFARAALLKARADEAPSVALVMLRGALAAAQEELRGFSESFAESFEALSDSVADSSTGALGETAAAKVNGVFGGAAGSARAAAAQASAAFAQLLAGLSEGASAAEGALPSAGRGLALARGLLLAAAVVARLGAF